MMDPKTFHPCCDTPVYPDLIGFDPVKKPSHYTAGRKYEPKDVIRDWDLNFNLGNAVKYISRAGRKNVKGGALAARGRADALPPRGRKAQARSRPRPGRN